MSAPEEETGTKRKLWTLALRLIGTGRLVPNSNGRQPDGSCLFCGGHGLVLKCPQCGKRWGA